MKVTVICSRMIPHPTMPEGFSSMESVAVDGVEMEFVACFSHHNGYHFIPSDSGRATLQAAKDAGRIDHFSGAPHIWKKDYLQLRIPVLKVGQQVRIIPNIDSFKCGEIEQRYTEKRIGVRSAAKKNVIPSVERPSCAVRGVLNGGSAMCGRVGVGGRDCHYEGNCEHQRAGQPTQGEAKSC